MYALQSCAASFQGLKHQTREARRANAMYAKKYAPPRQTGNAQAFMERDLSDQVAWLVYRAKSYGYANLDDLFGSNPAVYTQLAVAWRQINPLPATAQ